MDQVWFVELQQSLIMERRFRNAVPREPIVHRQREPTGSESFIHVIGFIRLRFEVRGRTPFQD